uniref:Uncharacterized protein n=1 Tax=Solanum lycopersicum TaxID=4081 RepID=A0A3Q7HBZ8_SOLLC
MQILESLYSGVSIVLSVLIEKSLLFISSGTNKLHDLIQDMSKYSVKMHKDDPGEYRRLWDAKDFEEVRVNNIVLHSILQADGISLNHYILGATRFTIMIGIFMEKKHTTDKLEPSMGRE